MAGLIIRAFGVIVSFYLLILFVFMVSFFLKKIRKNRADSDQGKIYTQVSQCMLGWITLLFTIQTLAILNRKVFTMIRSSLRGLPEYDQLREEMLLAVDYQRLLIIPFCEFFISLSFIWIFLKQVQGKTISEDVPCD